MTFFSCKEKPFSKKNIAYYVKLQDAFVAEVGTGIGNWTKIGYKMDNSSAFTYGGFKAGGTDGTVLLTAGQESAWTATAIGALNDCIAGSVWSLDVDANASAGGVATYTAKITNNDNNECDVLTPNYKRLSTGNNFNLGS